MGPLTAHACPYVTPSCLAAAERVHASGKELITALTLAHEIGGRVDASLAQLKVLKEEPLYYEESPRTSYVRTIFGGVAGAGKLLGLDASKMAGLPGKCQPYIMTLRYRQIHAWAFVDPFMPYILTFYVMSLHQLAILRPATASREYS